MGGQMKTRPLEKNIPAFIARPSGQIIAKWAYLEYQLSRTIWKLLDLSSTEGRLAVSDPRTHEKLDVIRNLLFTRKFGIDEKKFTAIQSSISEVQKMRDLLAHGLWVKDEKGWQLLNFRGNVVDQQIHKLGRNRKIRPESVLVTAENLAGVFAAVTALIGSVQSLYDTIPSPDKS